MALLDSRVGVARVVVGDDLPREREHEVVALVPVGGEALLGELALDGEGALQLLRHEHEGIGLEGVPVGHEDGLHGLGLPDAPGPGGCLPHGVDGVVGLESNRRSQGRVRWLPEAPRSWRPRRDGWNGGWATR